MSQEVRAAGGLVEHDGRVLLVHRPRYDDWSLPKGKLDAGEDWIDAALREVQEETGVRAEPGDELEPVRYTDPKGRPKIVRYWRMTPTEIPEFEPNDEVDEVAWLTPDEAAERLTYPHDVELLRAVGSDAGGEAAAQEIERKFLVARLPDDLDEHPSERIDQGYLATGDVEVRLRRAGERTRLSVKGGAGLVRTEEEVDLDPSAFDRLWPLTRGRRVEKVRHRIPAGSVTIELDRYEGKHRGLAVVEVEFESEDDAAAFQPPDWFGEDVTGDPAFANANLAG
jgi:CYTH domain-containing protein/8-oxo-dGTP pyrophosphatase MutT (NUDIX family)